MKKFIAMAGVAIAVLGAGSVSAQEDDDDYPPAATTTTSVAVGGDDVAVGGDDVAVGGDDDDADDDDDDGAADGVGGGGGQLPATGSDTNDTVWIAGGVLLAGLGLTSVSYYRRRTHAAA